MFNTEPMVFVFCALPCEAKPLIQTWKLHKRNNPGPFSIFDHPQSTHVVIITGLGKTAMATALGYTMGLFANPKLPILLNFGIAGHAHFAIGTAYLADKIIDDQTHQRFYPALPFSVPCPTTALTTRPTPETLYAKDCLYDMEGSAFYEAASKFTSGEFIQCLKVISDNAQSPITLIDDTRVSGLCGEQRQLLQQLIDALRELRASLPQPSLKEHAPLTAHFHFSASNNVKLKKLLLRWQVLHPQTALPWQDAPCRSGKELLIWLEGQLEEEFYL